MNHSKSIIFFDGICNLCNGSINFILKRDRNNQFLVGALQDDFSKKILSFYTIHPDYMESLILLEGSNLYIKSSAALRIAKKLNGLWPVFYIFIAIPQGIRDRIYDWIGRNRYRWFGKKNTCRVASPTEHAKFLSQENLPFKLGQQSES